MSLIWYIFIALIFNEVYSKIPIKNLKDQNDIEIADYAYPKKSDSKYFTVAIFGTNDLHGRIFPYRYADKNNKTFYSGGAEYIYKYANILRKEWGDQFIWLDAGDMFQGGYECYLTNQTIMNDYYNLVKLDYAAIGNHDFDYGVNHLVNFNKHSNYTILAANIRDITTGKYIWEDEKWSNVKPYAVKTIGKVKIGIIGLTTKETLKFTTEDLKLDFEDYVKVTMKFAKILREEEHCHAVIALTHFGPKCEKDENIRFNLRMWDRDVEQSECRTDNEYTSFINNLPPGTIDAVVAGHVHDVDHHFSNNIPVIQTDGFTYSNVMYLPFKIDGDDVELVNEEIKIEGPIPSCTKIWPDTKRCEFRDNADSDEMVDFTFHGTSVKTEPDLEEQLKESKAIIDAKYNNVYGYLFDEMILDDIKETLLTNFVVDASRIITNSDICFYNLGGYRTNWHKGNITEIDLYNMFPFDNVFVRFEMKGYELMHLFRDISKSLNYPQSGALQVFKLRNKRYEIQDMVLYDGNEETLVDYDKDYKVCTNDYLAGGGGEFGKVKKWYPKNIKEKKFGIIREGITNLIKSIKSIRKEYFVDENHPRITVIKEEEQ